MVAPAHLKALLRKNWLLFKRNKVGSFLEIAVPIAFAFVFLMFRHAEPIVEVPQTSYYDLPMLTTSYMKNCKAGQNGGKIGLSPPDDPIIQRVKAQIECINLYSFLSVINMLIAYRYPTEMFETNQDIDDYVQDIDYSYGDHRLCFAIVMDKNNVDDKYRYLLRFNTSLLPGREDIPETNSARVKEVEQ